MMDILDLATHKLKIIAGLHKNAELLLQQDVTYCIGSGDHCDVILLDSGIQKEHLRLQVTQDHIVLVPDNAQIFVDGCKVNSPRMPLSDYQVVTLGETHLAVGPADKAWPLISLPSVMENQDQPQATFDLVLVDTTRNLPQKIRRPGLVRKAFRWLCLFFAGLDKKTACAICLFLIVFALFVYDTWHWALPKPAQVSNTCQQQPKSVLLSLFKAISHARQDTFVNAGLEEPSIALQTAAAPARENPTDHIRKALKSTWGVNLTETHMADQSIQFKGYDEHHRTDLLLNLEQNAPGDLSARGYTLSPKKKKAFLSKLGDIMRVKVEAAQDMENLCRRVLEKKGVKRPEATFAIEENAMALQGESDDAKIISTIREIIAKAFPEIKISNKIKLQYPETAQVDIIGISTSGAPHVMLADGTKVFPGGKVNNDCSVTQIQQDHIVMNCNGTQVNKAVN